MITQMWRSFANRMSLIAGLRLFAFHGGFINLATRRMVSCLSNKIGTPPVELLLRDHRTTFCEGYSATIVVISIILGLFPSVACILSVSFVTFMRGRIVGME